MPVVKIAILFLLCTGGLAFAGSDFGHERWPAELVVHETWNLPRGISSENVGLVIYGNPTVGYFSVAKPDFRGRTLETAVFPPGYREKIEYHIRLKNSEKWIKLGEKKYGSPFVKSGLQPEAINKGHFSKPFILTTWA